MPSICNCACAPHVMFAFAGPLSVRARGERLGRIWSSTNSKSAFIPKRLCISHRVRQAHRHCVTCCLPKGSGSDRERERELEEAEEAELAALDVFAEEWIGANIARWEWYERIKSRRKRLREGVRERQRELGTQLDELRSAVSDLDTILDVGLVDHSGTRITPVGWAAVVALAVLQIAVAFTVFELMTNALMGMLPSDGRHPF